MPLVSSSCPGNIKTRVRAFLGSLFLASQHKGTDHTDVQPNLQEGFCSSFPHPSAAVELAMEAQLKWGVQNEVIGCADDSRAVAMQNSDDAVLQSNCETGSGTRHEVVPSHILRDLAEGAHPWS